MRKFIALNNGDLLCPTCGSLPRTRRLWNVIKDQLQDQSILHFSPSSSLQTKIQKLQTKRYVTTDFDGQFKANENYTIEHIPEENDSFDIIICYHILEHVQNDEIAMSELYRILKPDGCCYIQTPFKEGEILEDKDILTREDRLSHFGQEDHVRIYSEKGLQKRLEKAGFEVSVLRFKCDAQNSTGFKPKEIIFNACK